MKIPTADRVNTETDILVSMKRNQGVGMGMIVVGLGLVLEVIETMDADHQEAFVLNAHVVMITMATESLTSIPQCHHHNPQEVAEVIVDE